MSLALVASIPSPDSGVLRVGPLPLHAYGLMIALGIFVAARIAQYRWSQRGGDPKIIVEVTVPVVVGGLIGARAYHLFTGYDWNDGGIVGALQLWKGGLSIWGALAGGAVVLIVLARRRNLDVLQLLDAIGPAVAVAQAIGRWGNYFNQELFGRPTRLPWGLEIDAANRPDGYEGFETFHPTFLYESLWALLVFAAIVVLERHRPLRKGQAFAAYVSLYTLGRTAFEAIRIDDATRIFGLRFNLLLSAVLCVGAGVWFAYLGRHGEVSGRQRSQSGDRGAANR